MFFKKLRRLHLKVTGFFTPVAPFVTDFVDGLRDNPRDYVLVVSGDRSTIHVRQMRGYLADQGFFVILRAAGGDKFDISARSFMFEDIALNAKEAALIARAVEVWIKKEPTVTPLHQSYFVRHGAT